jgi:crossover junction endodeoxyribonuclease RuvC
MKIYVGVDPGASGAIAFFYPLEGRLEVVDMPVVELVRNGKTKKEISSVMLANVFCEDRSGEILDFNLTLEKVGAMPGQGVSSMFQFGRGVGMIEGVCAALSIPIDYVTPQTWQKQVGMRAGKDGARERAMQLFPAYAGLFARKKDDGRADAALIAYWSFTKNK